jgi:hypothetical protein
MGSAITYGRRYSLLAALGLATDEADDDGDRATPKGIEAPSHSANLDALLASLEKAKAKSEAAALVEWKSDQKNITKYNRLSEGEQAYWLPPTRKPRTQSWPIRHDLPRSTL